MARQVNKPWREMTKSWSSELEFGTGVGSWELGEGKLKFSVAVKRGQKRGAIPKMEVWITATTGRGVG
jgi:hypothetical protein